MAALIPPGTICGHKVPTIRWEQHLEWAYLPWLAVANSFAMDWLARSRLSSGSMTYTILDSLPFPRPALSDAFAQQVAPTVLRLICTAPEMTPFWNQMAEHGLVEPVPEGVVPASALVAPTARALACAELDALVALYVFGLTKDELSDVMDTFEVLRRREERPYGEFRTKRLVLEFYDAMTEARRTGQPYQIRIETRPLPHVGVERPAEIPLEVFAAMAYPATDADRAICAAALAIVEQSPGVSSADHLDALLLATHPDWCKVFLDQSDHRALGAAQHSALGSLYVGNDQSIRWKECRDYLEQLHAIAINRRDQGQAMGTGTSLASVKSSLPRGVDEIVRFALKAMERVSDLRKDLSSVPEEQAGIIRILEGQHKQYQLVA